MSIDTENILPFIGKSKADENGVQNMIYQLQIGYPLQMGNCIRRKKGLATKKELWHAMFQ
jgi:hypothetical protein